MGEKRQFEGVTLGSATNLHIQISSICVISLVVTGVLLENNPDSISPTHLDTSLLNSAKECYQTLRNL